MHAGCQRGRGSGGRALCAPCGGGTGQLAGGETDCDQTPMRTGGDGGASVLGREMRKKGIYRDCFAKRKKARGSFVKHNFFHYFRAQIKKCLT